MSNVSTARFARLISVGCILTAAFTPVAAQACACGCGVFDIASVGVAPNGADTGWTAFLRYGQNDQRQNWAGSSRISGAWNADRRITTSFLTFGAQYMINRDWGVMVEAPFVKRAFTTVWDADTGATGTYHLGAFG
ncbi:MAG: hypothetical protein KGL46_08125, partial [Hyphomicrobiales bacterium]|nr:hypothetical protein [Hyphomicrobiales bacterium]